MDRDKGKRNGLILVVDDDLDSMEIIKLILETKGFSILEAENGEDAVQRLLNDRRKEIWCVITDCSMPKMNGTQLCKKIRNSFKQVSCIILLTAQPILSNSCTDSEKNFNKEMEKPIDFDELVNFLRQWRRDP